LNLALNARDAMPGGGEVMVRAQAENISGKAAKELQLSPGLYVALSMKDNGDGMSQEVLSHAMEPFFTTKDVGKGSGMGLSMVFGFARQSGGTVTLDSKIGKGTTVTIYLPASTEELPQAKPAPPLSSIKPGHGNVLVVDDETDFRIFIAAALHELGYDMHSAETAADAIDILKRNKIDLLITDVIMPKVNGYQLAEHAYEMNPRLKILFISGYARKDSLPTKIPAHARGFLAKPFTLVALSQAIQALTAQKAV
jgi:CheY-like chemotaxis protein